MLEDSTMRLSTIGALLTLAFALLVAPRTTHAQQPDKVPHVGILSFFPAEPSPGGEELQWALSVEQALHDRGYVEGQNIRVERRSAPRPCWRARASQG